MFSLKDKTVSEYIDHVYRSMEYYLSLTPEQKNVIGDYKALGYANMNDALLGNPIKVYSSALFGDSMVDKMKEIAENIHQLANIIMNAPKIETDIEVYRGQKIPVHVESRTSDKLLFSNMNFFSTSIFKEVALDFTGTTCCLYKIRIPRGTPLLIVFSSYEEIKSVEDIEKMSVDYESEMILPPGCAFEVDIKPKYTDKEITRTKSMKVKELKQASQSDFKDAVLNKRHQVKMPIDTRNMTLIGYPNENTLPSREEIFNNIHLNVFLSDIITLKEQCAPSKEKEEQKDEIPPVEEAPVESIIEV